MREMKELIDLYLTFARIGAFTFGGGYAMLPMLEREVARNRHWATEEELMDYYAVGQCTPGVIAVNTGTFIGYKQKGIAGGIAATLGVVTPSVVIISVIAAFLQNFMDYWFVRSAFAGIRACVCVLIFNAVVKLGKKALVDKTSYILCGVIFLLAMLTRISSAKLVVMAGIVGLLVRRLQRRGQNRSAGAAASGEAEEKQGEVKE